VSRTLLLFALVAAPAFAAEGQFGLSSTRYTAWLNSLKKKTLRPVLVSVHTQGGAPVFSAVAVDNPGKQVWTARVGLTVAGFNTRFKQLQKDGYRLESLSAYTAGGGVKFADVWVKDKSVEWAARQGLTKDQYQDFFDEQKKKGLRPVCINGYNDLKGLKYAAVFHKGGGEWIAHHGITQAEYGKKLNDYKAMGYRLSFLSAFNTGGDVLVNIVVEKYKSAWALEHGITAAQLKDHLKKQALAGMELGGLTGYSTTKGSTYAAFWNPPKAAAVAEELPVTGTEVPALAAFDKAMLDYMKEREIESATLCVSRDGKIVLSRGYGWLTRDHTKKAPPTAPFRIASATKPITAAVIRKLARDGKLKLTDKAFELIGVDLAPGAKADPRLKDITIQHLLDHKGGFDSGAKPLGDPMTRHELIRKELKLSGPPSPLDVVRFMNGRKLDFAPGSKTVYSNYGYCILGRVIEKVTGATYESNARALLKPLGVTSVALGRSLPEKRNPLEPFYADVGMATNAITGAGKVDWPDGGFVLEMMDSHGGLIASAPDLARFLHAYWISGEPRKGGPGDAAAFGSLPGTFAMVRQRPDGTNIVALFNRRIAPAGKKPDDIQGILDKVADSIKKWP
jgi:CubicO group peptidase (beta-lactamase class C family)